jgi:hypothetical protein
METTKLENNAAALYAATQCDRHCAPATVLVRDGGHRGTILTWVGDKWVVYCLGNHESRGEIDRLAVVTLSDEAGDEAADHGINQSSVACDLEVPGGEWVVDADDLDAIREGYGDYLIVLWEQAG